jgi:hypothetical protein
MTLLLLALLPQAANAAFLRHAAIQDNADSKAASTAARHSSESADFNLRLDNFDNVQYSAPLSIGEQTLPVIYDTGSFEILVLSKLCHSCEARHAVYDQSQSTSFSATTPAVVTEHLFGSGPVVSQKGFETIHLGGLNSPLQKAHMPFWQVVRHEIAVWDENAHFSGIVGLGHPTYIPDGFSAESTDPDVLMLAAMGVKNFGLCLQRSSPAAPGWLIFGPSVDQMRTGGFFQQLDVVGKTHWGVMMYDFQVPGIVESDPCVPSCGAIIDSGTSLIAVPPVAMPMINRLSNMVARDCSNLHQLPVLKFRLGDHEVELPPKAYVMKVKKTAQNKSSIWNDVFNPNQVNAEHCVPAFMQIDKTSQYGPVWILGMPFLRYYYTIFDRMNKKVFIAEATPGCQPQPAASGIGTFVNVTHGLNGTGGAAVVHSRFAAEDFEPNEADPNEIRAPAWATEKANHSFPF